MIIGKVQTQYRTAGLAIVEETSARGRFASMAIRDELLPRHHVLKTICIKLGESPLFSGDHGI